MATTVLSGTSGALYYKPAGTTGTFGESGVDTATDTITVAPYLNFKVGDPVVFSVVNSQTGGSGTGTLPAGITGGTTYFVRTYTASSGALSVSATLGGALHWTSPTTAPPLLLTSSRSPTPLTPLSAKSATGASKSAALKSTSPPSAKPLVSTSPSAATSPASAMAPAPQRST
jgi:hypothetical protein